MLYTSCKETHYCSASHTVQPAMETWIPCIFSHALLSRNLFPSIDVIGHTPDNLSSHPPAALGGELPV